MEDLMQYKFEEHLAPIINGSVPVPNFEPFKRDHATFLNDLAAVGHSLKAVWGYAKHGEARKQWSMFFLTPSAMGNANHDAFDGGGYVVTYGPNGPICGTFAICRHTKVDGAGANPMRGWHPGRCSKCGLDMSVDSGD